MFFDRCEGIFKKIRGQLFRPVTCQRHVTNFGTGRHSLSEEPKSMVTGPVDRTFIDGRPVEHQRDTLFRSGHTDAIPLI